jgi:hypothetical protein
VFSPYYGCSVHRWTYAARLVFHITNEHLLLPDRPTQANVLTAWLCYIFKEHSRLTEHPRIESYIILEW